MAKPFLSESWYAAAALGELAEAPVVRRVLGHSLLLRRFTDGTLLAAEDLCPHRFAPLSKGPVHDDVIECPYHGLRFDRTGRCVSDAIGNAAPTSARLRTFPAVEKYGFVWVWMGQPDSADPERLPVIDFLEGPTSYRRITGNIPIAANYLHIVDNSMDTAHVAMVHRDSVHSPALANGKTVVRTNEDGSISADRCGAGEKPPRTFEELWNACLGPMPDQVLHWADARWYPATTITNDVGMSAVDMAREDGLRMRLAFFITPQDENSTCFHWTLCRNFLVDRPEADADIARGFVDVLKDEDGVLLAAIQETVGSIDIMDHKPALMNYDKAIVMVRRAMQQCRPQEEIGTSLSAVAR